MQQCLRQIPAALQSYRSQLLSPIAGKDEAKSYNGIISYPDHGPVLEKTHCTKPAVFQELVCVVVLLTLSHSLLCFLSCVPVHDLAIAPWQAYRERKVKTTASLSRMELIGD